MTTLTDRLAERLEMVERQIAARGVSDARVLHAMRKVPREMFLPSEEAEYAYSDRALSVGHGQTISQPYIVALMSECLDVAPIHHVLEIGTGTGYQTVLLAILAKHVCSVERIEELSFAARERFFRTGLSNADFFVGDGSMGWPERAPYDRIMVTAAAPTIPPTLANQLNNDGRMVIPIGPEGSQQLVSVERRGARFVERTLLSVRFVRLVGAGGYAE